MDELTDEVAVVTGAASGIGFALCGAFAAAGMRVVLADIHPAALEAAAERLGGDVLAVPTDVTSWDAVDELEARAVERFGNVHVLCNNAGVQLPGERRKAPPRRRSRRAGSARMEHFRDRVTYSSTEIRRLECGRTRKSEWGRPQAPPSLAHPDGLGVRCAW